MEEKRMVIVHMVNNIKSFISISDEKGIVYNKTELIKLMEWGNCILENNLGEQAVNRFIKLYNVFKKSISGKRMSIVNNVDSKVENTVVENTHEKELEEKKETEINVMYQLNLEKVKEHLDYFQEEIDIMGITFLLDKEQWGNTKNYYEFLTSYEKMRVLLKGFSTTIREYDKDVVNGNEGRALQNALRATRDCLATLMFLSDKIKDKTVWQMEDYKKTYDAFSDAVVDYMIINYLNNKTLTKCI